MDLPPKFLPIWNDVAFQELTTCKQTSRFGLCKPPDYGGVGIDINYDDNVLQCDILKHPVRQIDFAAQCCALPFIPVKMKDVADPCIEPLKKDRESFKNFSMRLTDVRKHSKEKIRAPILKTLQEKVLEIKNIGNYSEENSLKVPASFKYLAEHMPKRVIIPKFNVDYAGGNLALNKFNNHTVLHPSSDDLNQLCITPCQEDTDTHFKPLVSKQVTLGLKKEPVLQIESLKNEYCAIRLKSSFHLLNINNLKVNSKTVDKTVLYHIASSPYNPLEILSVYDKGILKLRNMEFRKTVWSNSDYVLDNFSMIHPTWRCDFGSQPFSALCMNEKYLFLFDFREDKIRELFYVQNPSFCVGEELVAMKLWSRNTFQHFLTSTDHFIICDERYPKKPVMLWNHALKDHPLYCDIADFQNSTKSAVIIGTQESRKIAAFLIDSGQTSINPISLGPPLELSTPSDCIESLKFHAYPVNESLSTRFSYPLTGVSIVPHNKETAFTAFQITSVGDLFYQDFKQMFSEVVERTYRVTTGCTLTPPEKIVPCLQDCLSSSDDVEVCNDEEESLARIIVNLYKILNLPKEISSNCSLCRLNNLADKELVITDICPGCNLNTAESQHISKAWTNSSVIIGPASNEANFLDCDVDYLSQFTDIYSKRMLSIWTDSDDSNENASQIDGDTETNMDVDIDRTLSINFDSSTCVLDDITPQNENMTIHTNSQALIEASLTEDLLIEAAVEKDYSFVDSQDYSGIIPPSQEARSLIGETLFTPVKTKLHKNRSKISSAAGF